MKTVLVTGATGEIGSAIVNYFFRNGYFVYIHYNTKLEKAEKLLESIEGKGKVISFDMKDSEKIKSALVDLEVDVLVNNAGIIRDNLFFFLSDEDWLDVINTNLNGLFFVTRQIMHNMIRNKKGSVVNVASISGIIGNPGQTNYSAAKGGVIAFTKALAAEVARYGIRVNCVAPGIIESELTAHLNTKELIRNIPLLRFGKPDEVAETVFFLSDKAGYITGEVINISGGLVR